ncbi:3TM-type holin [Thaumasiovibrio subtropicus]|uniref:3TM-type holin n=1 Tax=Thaumasiovibrio subtropicus TaxID=1891207 RepID=UPI000B35EA3F|nr:3TM-type holin [Thaumasiovibrio subtropicus]
MPNIPLITPILDSAGRLLSVLLGSKSARDSHKHIEAIADIDRDAATLAQFATEFHARQNRTGWDAFVDGLNRLPRPLMTFSILGFFIVAPMYPDHFLKIAQAYTAMPAGYWALLSVIVGFYFGGRMQLKAQDFAVTQEALTAAGILMERKRDETPFEDELETTESLMYEDAVKDPQIVKPNTVIERWRRHGPNH